MRHWWENRSAASENPVVGAAKNPHMQEQSAKSHESQVPSLPQRSSVAALRMQEIGGSGCWRDGQSDQLAGQRVQAAGPKIRGSGQIGEPHLVAMERHVGACTVSAMHVHLDISPSFAFRGKLHIPAAAAPQSPRLHQLEGAQHVLPSKNAKIPRLQHLDQAGARRFLGAHEGAGDSESEQVVEIEDTRSFVLLQNFGMLAGSELIDQLGRVESDWVQENQ